MTWLTHRSEGPAFVYAGQPMHILAGHGGRPPGFAAMEITIPAHFAGPIPHAHDEFDEAIYVLTGHLLVIGDDEPREAAPGSMFVAARGQRHGFSNPSDQEARVLGLWAPPAPALAFMREIGAALIPGTPPDPDRMRDIYTRHASRLLPLHPPRQPPAALTLTRPGPGSPGVLAGIPHSVEREITRLVTGCRGLLLGAVRNVSAAGPPLPERFSRCCPQPGYRSGCDQG